MEIIAFPRAHSQCGPRFNDPLDSSPLWATKKKPSPLRRQFTIAMPWPPKIEDDKKKTFLPDIQANSNSEKINNAEWKSTKQRSGIDTSIIKKSNSLKTIKSSHFKTESAKTFMYDVTACSRTSQTLNDNKNLNGSIDRLEFKAIQPVGIKREPQSKQPIHSLIPRERRGPLNPSKGKHFRVVTILYNTMASLKLDNRQELASNDHARHHNKRQQQWIRSEQVKNWRRSTVNKVSKKPGYTSGSSSGQKSDVISGNSDDTIHTSSSHEEANQVFECPMGAERKESFDKCLKWMETLPEKFSGMHIFTPCVSD